MLHPSTKRLIDKLDEMTRKQRVSWQESENGSVTHDTEGYRVVLTAPPHTLLLTDAKGREIETCAPEDFTGETDAGGQPYADFVAELYREAHRHARGAERAISALLSSLDKADLDEVEEAAAAVEAAPEPESFDEVEDEGDESRPLEDHELPEFEGQSDMQKAVAAMADEVNGPGKAEAPEEAEAEADAEFEPEPEPVELLATAAEPEPESEPEAAASAEPDTASLYAPFAGSTGDAQAYAIAAEFTAPAPAEEAPPAEPPEPEAAAEPEPFAGQDDVWNAIQSAGTPGEMPESEAAAAAEPEPQPEPPEEPHAPQNGPGPVFGSALFGGGTNTLSHHQPEPPAEPVTEPAPEATTEAAPAPDPAPEPQPEPTPRPQAFSLSGITSGFGLGTTHPGAAVRHQPPAAPVSGAEPGTHTVIDGTLDLPDTVHAPEAAPTSGYRMEEDESFDFTEADLMPGVEAAPLPATPVPASAPGTQPPEDTAEQASETETEKEQPPKPARRFNPWN